MGDSKKKRRSLLMFHSRSSQSDESSALSLPPSPVEARASDHFDASPTLTSGSSSPTTRPRLITKPNRNSVFGSLRSLHSWDEEEKLLAKIDSKASSIHGDADSPTHGLFGSTVKRAAELSISGMSVFRKKTQYIVLTESHIIRFKNQSKAAEMFPIIPHTGLKNSISRTNSGFPSSGSFADLQSLPQMDITQGVPLDEVVAVYRLEDGRPYCTLEVAYADEKGRRASTLQLNFSGPKDADLWQQTIREQAALRRSLIDQSYQRSTLEYLARILQREKDYDPLHFRVFKVAQRVPVRPAANKVSSDDLAKGASVCYLVIGVNRVHLIPLPTALTKKSSSTSLSEIESPSSFGITNLTSVKLRPCGDSFELYFRTPLKNPYVVSIASYDAESIALWLRFAFEYLCPEWVVQPFVFDVPAGVDERMDPPNFAPEENNCFDRTLIAFCSAFEIDASKISYSVDYAGEDAPCLRLLPSSTGYSYTAFELLAVFRALRYNESFTSLSFADIDLGPLRTVYDPFGASDDSICGRNGRIIDFPGHGSLSVLQQELRALALKSRKLRRFDFTNSLPSVMQRTELSSGIPQALTPLCKKSLTNVDWITLNGVRLTEHDIDFLVDAASERQCHLRALEVGRCGLSVHDVDVLLSTLGIHDNTMEVIDISGSQGRFSPELFQRAIGAFTRIRKLDLTRIQKTAGPEPLVAPEILLSWRLQSLRLNGCTLNEQSVDTIAAYLSSPKSNLLRELSVDQCGLNGKDLAILLRSMSRDGYAREMHLSANENRLGQDSSHFCRCIAKNHAPTSLSMRMIDFGKEYQFRELIVSLTQNTTIRRIDISQASLPYDATMETCEALKEMFATNHILEDLDISGDVAHLDTARFGIGLNIALLGLERNDALKMLRIENQNLGLQGANTLAGVIEKNTCLTEIHCAHNDIQLQSFTVLVNALRKNKSLLFMPSQDHDRAKSIEKLREEFESYDKSNEPKSPRPSALKKSISAVTAVSRHRRQSSTVSNASHHSFSQQDLNDAIGGLQDKWNVQTARLQQYLLRNYQLASGLTWEELDKSGHDATSRPATADSLTKMLAKLQTHDYAAADRVVINPKSGSNSAMIDEKATTDTDSPPFVFTLPED